MSEEAAVIEKPVRPGKKGQEEGALEVGLLGGGWGGREWPSFGGNQICMRIHPEHSSIPVDYSAI